MFTEDWVAAIMAGMEKEMIGARTLPGRLGQSIRRCFFLKLGTWGGKINSENLSFFDEAWITWIPFWFGTS